MDLNNPVLKLCVEGTQAEFKGQIEEAKSLYQQAWEAVSDDFDACVAAHYVARFQEDPNQRLYWNQLALNHANAVSDDRVKEFYPSLYLNMGQSFERLGHQEKAKYYYDLAAKLGITHQPD
jgi:tetratricopeptide (TPR) repeat protein